MWGVGRHRGRHRVGGREVMEGPSAVGSHKKARQDYPRNLKRIKRFFRQREQHITARSFEDTVHWRFKVWLKARVRKCL